MGIGSALKKGLKVVAGIATLGVAGGFIGNAPIIGELVKSRADRKAALEAGQLRAVQAAISNKKLDLAEEGLDISESRRKIGRVGLDIAAGGIRLDKEALKIQQEQSQLGFGRLDNQQAGIDISRAEIDLGERARDIQTSRANRQTLASSQIEQAKIRAGAAASGAAGSTSSQGQRQGARSAALEEIKFRGDLRSLETEQANLGRGRLDLAEGDLDISRKNLDLQQGLFSLQNTSLDQKLRLINLQKEESLLTRDAMDLERKNIGLDRELIGHTQGVEDRIAKRGSNVAPWITAGSLVTTGIGLLSGGAGSLLAGFNLAGGAGAGGFNSAFSSGNLASSGGGGNFNSGLNF